VNNKLTDVCNARLTKETAKVDVQNYSIIQSTVVITSDANANQSVLQ